MKRLFYLLFIIYFSNCCNDNSTKYQKINNESLIYRFNIERKINTFEFIEPNGNRIYFDSIKYNSFMLFVPSACCSQCYSNIYNYIFVKLKNENLFIICDNNSIRKSLYNFPNYKILAVKNLDEFVKVENSIFIRPFIYYYNNGKCTSGIVIEKNEKSTIKTFIDYWIRNKNSDSNHFMK